MDFCGPWNPISWPAVVTLESVSTTACFFSGLTCQLSMEKIFVADSRILKWPGINWPEDVFCVIFKVVKICFMT